MGADFDRRRRLIRPRSNIARHQFVLYHTGVEPLRDIDLQTFGKYVLRVFAIVEGEFPGLLKRLNLIRAAQQDWIPAARFVFGAQTKQFIEGLAAGYLDQFDSVHDVAHMSALCRSGLDRSITRIAVFYRTILSYSA